MLSVDASKRETNRQDGESGESGERGQTLGCVGVRVRLDRCVFMPIQLYGAAHKYFCSS